MSAPVVWLVVGDCGDYSDRAIWTVAAYFDRAKAEAHAAAANVWCMDFLAKTEASVDYIDGEDYPCPVDRVRASYRPPNYTTKEKRGDYRVSPVALHSDVTNYDATEAVVLDWMKENGVCP